MSFWDMFTFEAFLAIALFLIVGTLFVVGPRIYEEREKFTDSYNADLNAFCLGLGFEERLKSYCVFGGLYCEIVELPSHYDTITEYRPRIDADCYKAFKELREVEQ